MKIRDYISNKIDRFQRGYVFTYNDFDLPAEKKEGLIKALNRMAGSGKITKLSKGKYYKAESTPFGQLMPDQAQVVKDLLEDEGKITGYLTGLSIFNKLGLSSQVSSVIQIGKNELRPAFKRERYTILFIRQKNIITKDNIPLLQILDCIRYIKKIPDSTIADSCARLLSIIKSLNSEEKGAMVRLALKYSPATRALFGAILENIGDTDFLLSLKKSLNPITTYQLPGAAKSISSTANWNIL